MGQQNRILTPKGNTMTMMKTLRNRLAKRAAYNRTRDAIASLPVERAVEDLGLFPADADQIALRAVYN